MADDSTLDLIEREIPRLRRFARSLTRDVDRADDLVQECLVRAINKLDSWTPGTNLRAWLFTILRNAFLNEIRRSKGSPISSVEIDPDRHESNAPDGESLVVVGQIAREFERLSDEHRQVLSLIAIEGFAYDEAAEICDVPVGTIRSRLSRARETLRQSLLDGGIMTESGGQ